MAKASTELKNKALFAMAAALRKEAALICAENAVDCAEARKAGTKDSLIDRLFLDEGRIEGMASALESLASLDDPRRQDLRAANTRKRFAYPKGFRAVGRGGYGVRGTPQCNC